MRFAVAAIWMGAFAGGAAAQTALPDSRPLDAGPLAVARVCAYPLAGGGVLLGRDAPIRCDPPAAESTDDATGDVFAEPVPASNPLGAVPRPAPPPRGFEGAWDDGRINPGRGVPFPVSGPAVLGARVVGPSVVAGS